MIACVYQFQYKINYIQDTTSMLVILPTVSQHRIRWWFCVVWQQAINWKNVDNVLCEVARGHWNNLVMDSVWFGIVFAITPQSNRIKSWVPPLGQLSNLEWDACVSCLRCTDTTAKSVERYISSQRCNFTYDENFSHWPSAWMNDISYGICDFQTRISDR